MAGITYRDAGVDIDAGERLVDRIKPFAARTRIPEVMGNLGGFAGLCSLPQGMTDPVMVSGTDGVGTKLKLAFMTDVHDTVGIDLVAMCVNDIITVGARPLFFLDYFGTGKLAVDAAADVIKGIAAGCEQAGCALLGGETAELPGFYKDGEYDLAGFAVGVVERSKILDGKRIEAGDVVLGVSSSGLHSNGFSLARKVLLEHAKLSLDAQPEGLEENLGRTLLTPTRIYAKAVAAALEAGDVRGLCHVTGGGLVGNLPRILPEGLGARVREDALPVPPIFELIRREGEVETHEMRRTFNMGIGLTVIVPKSDAAAVQSALEAQGETCAVLGEIETTDAQGEARVRYEA